MRTSMTLGVLILVAGIVLWATLGFRSDRNGENLAPLASNARGDNDTELVTTSVPEPDRSSPRTEPIADQPDDPKKLWTREETLQYVRAELRAACTTMDEQDKLEFAGTLGNTLHLEKKKLPDHLTASEREELLALIDEISDLNREAAAQAADQLSLELDSKWERGGYTMTENGVTIHEPAPSFDPGEQSAHLFRRHGAKGPFSASLSLSSAESPQLTAFLTQIRSENQHYYRRRDEILATHD